jgi:sulfite exporter TauE/SafE/copper chaperone CopZ
VPTTELEIAGMTCRACETRVGAALRRVPGVRSARVSARRGIAVVRTTGPVPRADLVAAVRAAGYAVGPTARPWLSRDPAVWRDVALATAVVGAVALVARATGALDAVAGAGGAVADGGLVVALLLGLAAGLSTCMALVGGVVLAVSARFAEQHPDLGARQRLHPHLAFHAGRVVGFTVLGAATGAAGAAFTLDPRLVAVLVVAVSVVMGTVGLRLAAVSPRLSAGGLALPASLARALRLDRAGAAYRDRTAALLGAGSYLLPCGFTQAVQVYALATGSPGRAAAVMGLFALGTTPGLLGLGGVTAVVRGASAERFLRVAGVVVVAFALVNVTGAVRVLAPGLGGGAAAAARTPNVSVADGVQVLRTAQVATGYEPAEATVYAGQPVRWEVDSRALGCATALYVPDLGISELLESGTNVFAFTPDEPGTIRYSCAMGMYRGAIHVVEPPAA